MSPRAFLGRKNAMMCLFAGFLSIFHGRSRSGAPVCHSQRLPFQQQGVVDASAFNQYGKWLVVQSNDPLVDRLPAPRVVDISDGKFRIGAKVFGGFRMVDPPDGRPSGIYVSMTMYNIGLLKRIYNVVPLDPYRMALFGVGQRTQVYYILERFKAHHRHDGADVP